MKERPYDLQEEDFVKLLCIKPEMTNALLEELYVKIHNQAPTYSAMARARERLGMVKHRTESDKQVYMWAWWTLNPKGRAKSLHGKMLDVFEEDTRSDQLDRWKAHAEQNPHPTPKEVIDRYEKLLSKKHRNLGLEG